MNALLDPDRDTAVAAGESLVRLARRPAAAAAAERVLARSAQVMAGRAGAGHGLGRSGLSGRAGVLLAVVRDLPLLRLLRGDDVRLDLPLAVRDRADRAGTRQAVHPAGAHVPAGDQPDRSRLQHGAVDRGERAGAARRRLRPARGRDRRRRVGGRDDGGARRRLRSGRAAGRRPDEDPDPACPALLRQPQRAAPACPAERKRRPLGCGQRRLERRSLGTGRDRRRGHAARTGRAETNRRGVRRRPGQRRGGRRQRPRRERGADREQRGRRPACRSRRHGSEPDRRVSAQLPRRADRLVGDQRAGDHLRRLRRLPARPDPGRRRAVAADARRGHGDGDAPAPSAAPAAAGHPDRPRRRRERLDGDPERRSARCAGSGSAGMSDSATTCASTGG